MDNAEQEYINAPCEAEKAQNQAEYELQNDNQESRSVNASFKQDVAAIVMSETQHFINNQVKYDVLLESNNLKLSEKEYVEQENKKEITILQQIQGNMKHAISMYAHQMKPLETQLMNNGEIIEALKELFKGTEKRIDNLNEKTAKLTNFFEKNAKTRDSVKKKYDDYLRKYNEEMKTLIKKQEDELERYRAAINEIQQKDRGLKIDETHLKAIQIQRDDLVAEKQNLQQTIRALEEDCCESVKMMGANTDDAVIKQIQEEIHRNNLDYEQLMLEVEVLRKGKQVTQEIFETINEFHETVEQKASELKMKKEELRITAVESEKKLIASQNEKASLLSKKEKNYEAAKESLKLKSVLNDKKLRAIHLQYEVQEARTKLDLQLKTLEELKQTATDTEHKLNIEKETSEKEMKNLEAKLNELKMKKTNELSLLHIEEEELKLSTSNKEEQLKRLENDLKQNEIELDELKKINDIAEEELEREKALYSKLRRDEEQLLEEHNQLFKSDGNASASGSTVYTGILKSPGKPVTPTKKVSFEMGLTQDSEESSVISKDGISSKNEFGYEWLKAILEQPDDCNTLSKPKRSRLDSP